MKKRPIYSDDGFHVANAIFEDGEYGMELLPVESEDEGRSFLTSLQTVIDAFNSLIEECGFTENIPDYIRMEDLFA